MSLTNILDLEIDGVKVRDTDLSKINTAVRLRDWQDKALMLWQEANGIDTTLRDVVSLTHRFQPVQELNILTAARRDELIAACEARMADDYVISPRNLDVVVKQVNEWSNWSSVHGERAAREIDLKAFTDATQMTAYEHDAYKTVGQEACDEQGVETLYDLFGSEWSRAFFKRKNALIAKEKLPELYRERDDLNDHIAELEALLDD